MRAWVAWAMVGVGMAAAAGVTREVMSRRLDQAPTNSVSGVLEQAAPNAGGPAFQRVARLRRGINMSGWYADTAGHEVAGQPDAYVSDAELRRLKELGIDHVRLSIDPVLLIADVASGALRPDRMTRLDKTVRRLTGFGFNVVLDAQPEESWKGLLVTGDAGVANFLAFWGAFAGHFAGTDPERVFFEVMNEPTMADRYRWEGVQASAVARIRGVAPRHTVIASAPPYSDIAGLVAMEPVRDEDVIYTFHEYDPRLFTHQGATWGSKEWVALRGVPYPVTPEGMAQIVGREADAAERLRLEQFAAERWDAARIEVEIAKVDRWARARGVPVYCGEFGVYRDFADPKARVRWIADARMAMEAKGIGWAMWDYDGNFGLMTGEGRRMVVDKEVVKALGLGR